MEKNTICVWGDSLAKGIYYDESRGRYAILRESCLRLLEKEGGFTVWNHAVMGLTAKECLARTEADETVPGAVAAFEFGGNDSDMDWAAVAREPEREHPARSGIGEFRSALRGLAAFARRREMEPMFVTPLPLDGEKYFRWVSRSLDGAAILRYLGGDAHMMYRWQEQYAAAVRDAAREENARLLDLRGAFLSDRRFREYYCLDGIHLNQRGHRKMYEFIMGEMKDGAVRSLAG